jgi:hypothetical protein
LLEVQDAEAIPGQSDRDSVVVPLIGGLVAAALIDVSVGRDVSLTPEIEAELGGELEMEPAMIRSHLATFGAVTEDTPDDVARREPTIAPSQRADVLRAALSEDVQLPSSLIRGRQTWRVNDLSHLGSGAARVSLGRQDMHEIELVMPRESAQALHLGDSVMGADVLWRKDPVLGFGRVEVEFVPGPGEPTDVPIWIPLVRLHRPKRTGCQATYSVGRQNVTDVGMTVTVLGSGGGGGVKTTLSVRRDYTATSRCVETVIPAKLRIRVGRTLVNGTEVSYGIRTEVVDIDTTALKKRPVAADEDSCQRSAGALGGLPTRDYDYTSSPKGDSATDDVALDGTAGRGRGERPCISRSARGGNGAPMAWNRSDPSRSTRSSGGHVDVRRRERPDGPDSTVYSQRRWQVARAQRCCSPL